MKELKCEVCSAPIQGESFDQWMDNAMAHWKENHTEDMKKMGEGKSPEEQEKDKQEWMDRAKKAFEEAPEM